MRALVVVLSLAGCLEADLVECADDRVCPSGTACDVAHHDCVDPAQLAACEGLEQFADCAAVDSGRCFDGVCLAGGCGNGFVEPEENCDDHNTLSGDGCSAECDSREICGDGFIDAKLGETCDDGNLRGRDGCSAACTVEDRAWRLYGAVPAARQRPALAFDPARNRLVLFGGGDSELATFSDIWEWNGKLWSEAKPTTIPVKRSGAALAYDPVRKKLVMFGGLATVEFLGLLGDTWEWDGVNWERLRPPLSPRARTNASMAWDGSAIVLVGGDAGGGGIADTWRWDGTAWTEVLGTQPSIRTGAALVFDAARNQAVLFGGRSNDGPLNDTWVFDGAWAPLATTGTPPPMDWSVGAYDPIRNVTVVSGLVSPTPVVWELAGTTWTDRSPASSPIVGGEFALAYDFNRRTVVQFGGIDPTDNSVLAQMIEWNGTAWSTVTPTKLPDPRHSQGFAIDPFRGRALMFGGIRSAFLGGATLYADTWEWDGRGWTEVATTGPSKRRSPAMVFDEAHRVAMLFGGSDETPTVFADTWIWNGSWTLSPATGPSARVGASIVYDPIRERVVMFGGQTATGFAADTWEWNGTSWTLVATAGPSARTAAAIAFDRKRERVVLFGGTDGAVKDDTWEWDGTAWSEVSMAIRPEARAGARLVFDHARGRVALFGGDLIDFSPWEWDGVAWVHESPSSQPGFRIDPGAGYDTARSEIVVFGGSLLLGSSQETFTASYIGSPVEICGFGGDLDRDGASACADSDCELVCEGCGDGVCGELESDRTCPEDCAPMPICGDGFCSPNEPCPADC